MLYVVLAIVAVLVISLIAIYNGLIKGRTRADEAWSDITVQLKRRADLIPNLVETVKGYAGHEKEVFENVTQARAGLLNAQGVAETAKADNMFQQTLKSLFAVAENYPQLKANENFQSLQNEVTDTEDKIQAARRFYNSSARDYNIKTKVFPTSLFASIFGFKEKEFFGLDEAEAAKVEKPVEVKF